MNNKDKSRAFRLQQILEVGVPGRGGGTQSQSIKSVVAFAGDAEKFIFLVRDYCRAINDEMHPDYDPEYDDTPEEVLRNLENFVTESHEKCGVYMSRRFDGQEEIL